MRRLFVPTMGPSDWRRLLADPQKHWRESKSAYEAAVAWEAARKTLRGLPPEMEAVFDSHDAFRGASLLLGLPEHQVELEGGGHASQTDFWALLAAPILGTISMAVEAKAGEPFDKTVSEWLAGKKESSGKPTRLAQLCRVLAMEESLSMNCRYQLMHRPVAAILEAKRFRLDNALFMVQAFGKNERSFQDYRNWAAVLGVEGKQGSIERAGKYDGVDLWIGWVDAPVAGHTTVRAAV